MRDLHAAPAAARRGFDQDRIADLVGDAAGLGIGRDAALRARHHRNAEAPGGALGLDLVTHDADVFGLGADEVHVVIGEDFGKARVLRQEAVAGMHGVGAGDLAGGENVGDVEIAVFRRRRADADALVGKTHMHGVGVGGGMHGDGRNAELLAGAQDAQRDLAAIGDQDFIEHCFARLRAVRITRLSPAPRRIPPAGRPRTESESRCRRAAPESGSWSSSPR